MTKKRNLTTFMIAIMIMLFSLPANAQGTVGYVVWDGANTLTFKGGTSVPTTGAYELNTGSNRPGWISDVASSCTQVVFHESFNDVRPTSCYQWFQGFSKLSKIEGIRYLNTDNVTTMQAMFDGCSGLTTLNLSNFNTANVEYMDNMFNGCSGLTSLDLSSFNTANVTAMDYMFNRCSGLTSLDLSSFNTDKVGSMYNMFYDCSGLTSLDLSSFNTANVTDMDNMFYGCSGLTTIYVSDDFTTDEVSYNTGMFGGCSQLNGFAAFDPNKTDKDMANCETGYFTESNLTPYVKWNGYTKVLTFKVANYTEGTQVEWKLNEGDTSPGWVDNVSSVCEKVVFTPSFKQAKPTSCSHWFYGFSNLMSIQGIENLNTEEVKNMSCMFYSCQKLTSLDVSKFNTDKVKNMSSMFQNCSGLTSLDLSSFNTAEVENMSCMFSNCSGLSSLDVSKFNTDKVTDMSGMLKGCKKLSSLDLSSFNTAKVMYMNDMFNYCSGLLSLDLSSFNTAEVTNMNDMFNYCSGLDNLDLSSFNTAKVTEMGYMFYGCSKLTTIYVSDDFTIVNVTYGSNMFSGCTSLKKGDVSYDSGKTGIDMANYKTGYFTESNLTPYVKWNADTKVLTFKVANYIEGTQGEWKLNEGDTYPGWSGLEVTNNCTNVVFTPSFKQAKPTSCYMWFCGFWQLTTIEGIENLNTEEVTNMRGMFWGCSGLTSLDLSSFNTAKVTDMNSMFNGCSDLTSLDVSSFNTAKVTNMSCMFGNCTGLKSLDVSKFNTAEVTDMRFMFNGCSGLTTIYVSDDFKIGNGTDGYEMFFNCSNLKGAVAFDSNKIDHTMANYTSGYFKTYFTLGDSKVELCGEPLTTEILDLSGDDDFVAHAPFTANEATYSRDLSTSESTWFSLCLPFAYTPNNFTAYQLNGATANAVEIEEITGTIAAGTPVLFKFKDGVVDVDKKIEIFATGANIVNAPVVDGSTAVNGPNGSSLQLCGTYQTKTFSKDADGNAFILLNNKLMNPAKMLENKNVSKVSVKPFRAYMTLTAPAQTSSARAFSIGHGDEGNEGTSAIDLLNSVATDDAEYYDINGRRIDAPAKGVNIVRRGNKTMKLIIK